MKIGLLIDAMLHRKLVALVTESTSALKSYVTKKHRLISHRLPIETDMLKYQKICSTDLLIFL